MFEYDGVFIRLRNFN